MMNSQIHFNTINPELENKPTIVFLHEGLGCIKTWKNYPQKLCDQLKLKGISYDRAGYGESAGDLSKRTNDYLIDAAEELHQLLKDQKLKKVVLYGHSDGGSIALAFAAKYPQQVICMIAEAAHVLNEKETIEGIEKAVQAFQAGKMEGLSKWHGNNYKSVFKAWASTWLLPEFDLLTLKNLLPNIQANQLIIQGTEDRYGTLAQVKTIQQLSQGNTTTFIPQCGHAPFLEAEDKVLAAVIKFLQFEIYGNS